MNKRFHHRKEAGQRLADQLIEFKNQKEVLVLALPRGGVPVAFEIAKKLNLPLDICLVRKLGVPDRQELAMGAIASNGVRIINQAVVNWLNISPGTIEQVTETEAKELQRRDRTYRGDKPSPNIENQTIILVDDGIATGSTLQAAIALLKQQHPRQIIIAVPVAPPAICQELRTEVDQLVCLEMPDNLTSISLWYDDFSQTGDQEVCRLLAIADGALVN